MTGIPLLIAFALAIIMMIVAIAKWKLHPFLAIMSVSLIMALIAGIPLDGIPTVIGEGFSGTFSSIGIVIILGALIGVILEKTGAALKMADVVIRLVGKRHPEAALMLMGLITAVPIFCDSAFVILDPIRKSLIRRTGKSSVACTMALSLGLYLTHCLIVPASTPIAACNILYSGMGMEANLLQVMGVGAVCAILPAAASYFFALRIGQKVRANHELAARQDMQTDEEPAASHGTLPGGWMSFAPILLPIFLMCLSSGFAMAGIGFPLIAFLGTPVIALAAGVLAGVWLLARSGHLSDFHALTGETLKNVGPILFVTAAGSVLGNVIASSDLVAFIKANASVLQSLGLFFPFLLAAILKTAQGSSTVALTTTAGMMAPLMTTLGFTTGLDAALVVAAIGAGAMTVTHASDGYFWLVTHLGDIKPQDGYRTLTAGTFIAGLSTIISVWMLSILF